MTAEEVKQSITAWCSSDDDLAITGERVEPSTDFALGVRAGGVSGSPVELEVLQGQGADRITVRRTISVEGEASDAARELIEARPGSVTADIDRADGSTSVTAQTYVYLDGLSRHSFMQAIAELARTSRLLGGLSGSVTAVGESAAAATAYTPAASPAYSASLGGSPYPAGVAAGQPVGATPVAASQPLPSPSFTPTPAAAPQPAPTAQWVPTHSVPPQGLRSWAAPDPNGPVVANLAPGLPIQVTEVRGAWARIVCSNGWTGWIDGRIIGVAA